MKAIEKFSNLTTQKYQALSPQAKRKIDEKIVEKTRGFMDKLSKKLISKIKAKKI